ncbi:MAG: cytochrome c oxidase assembly protein [Candidatus Dormibacteria bacterium]
MPQAHLSLLDWSWEPTILLGTVAAVALYALGWRRGWLRASDDVSPWFRSPRTRAGWFAAGMSIAYVALSSPIDRGGDEYLFSLHMVQHLLLMMVAPPLLLLGLAGWHPPAAARWWRRLFGIAVNPAVALLLFTVVLLVWHIPALYDATLTTEPIHVVEHLSFIAVAVVFWWPIVDPQRTPERQVSPFLKIAMLVASGIPPTVLGLLFTVGSHPFYDFYARAPRLWGLTPVADQQIAGVIMFGAGNIIYFVAISIVFWRLFADPAADEAEATALPPVRSRRSLPKPDVLPSKPTDPVGTGGGGPRPHWSGYQRSGRLTR